MLSWGFPLSPISLSFRRRSILAALLLHIALVLPALGTSILVTGLARLFDIPRVLAGVTAVIPPVRALRLRMGGRRVGADCEREAYRTERGQHAYDFQVRHGHVPPQAEKPYSSPTSFT